MARFVPNQNARFNHALLFAAIAHGNQVREGNEHIPYIMHPIDVAHQVIHYSGLSGRELEHAVIVSILHDTVEDTPMTLDNILEQFGEEIAFAVSALTRVNEGSSTSAPMQATLERIRAQPAWVHAVKLADRISNLREFPADWDRERLSKYLEESVLIAHRLGDNFLTLNARLLSRVSDMRNMLSLRS